MTKRARHGHVLRLRKEKGDGARGGTGNGRSFWDADVGNELQQGEQGERRGGGGPWAGCPTVPARPGGRAPPSGGECKCASGGFGGWREDGGRLSPPSRWQQPTNGLMGRPTAQGWICAGARASADGGRPAREGHVAGGAPLPTAGASATMRGSVCSALTLKIGAATSTVTAGQLLCAAGPVARRAAARSRGRDEGPGGGAGRRARKSSARRGRTAEIIARGGSGRLAGISCCAQTAVEKPPNDFLIRKGPSKLAPLFAAAPAPTLGTQRRAQAPAPNVACMRDRRRRCSRRGMSREARNVARNTAPPKDSPPLPVCSWFI